MFHFPCLSSNEQQPTQKTTFKHDPQYYTDLQDFIHFFIQTIFRAEQITKDDMIPLPLTVTSLEGSNFFPNKNLSNNSGYNISPYYLYIMPNTIVLWGPVHDGPDHPL